MLRRWWIAPLGVALIGIGLSVYAFWIVRQADDRHVRHDLEYRTEWRARDLEAKIRLSGNAVENLAVAMAASPALDPETFGRIAARAARGLAHVNALQWAPRVPRERIAAFEEAARAQGLRDYRVFDVTPEFRPAALAERAEYFPVLHDARFHGARHVLGLALGRHDGRRLPMVKAQESGIPVATAPVRPVGPPTPSLVYLLFWPVYAGVDVPPTVEERREKLRGFALGNYNVAALLDAALRDTPEIIETIRFAISSPAHSDNAAAGAVAVYSPETRSLRTGALTDDAPDAPALRIRRHFEAFGQNWDLTFDYSAATIAGLRSGEAWVWLLAGLLLTASLVAYLLRERGRTAAIEALAAERTVELQHTSEQLHQAQKMEAIGNLTGGMAHDFNNLLSVVIGNLDLLQAELRNHPRAAGFVEAALQAGLRGAELTRQLLAFARRQPLAPKLIDVNELVSGMTRLLERTLEKNIEIALIIAPDVWPVTIDPAQLSAAIANLATNARDAMPDGGRLTIETRNTSLDADYCALNPEVSPGDFVLIEVSDTGTGMSPETLARAFEPFYTTKDAGRGTGLGLSMVFGFVKQSHGHIKIYSELDHGTSIRIYLPRTRRDLRDAAEAAPAAAPSQKGHERVLVVEDDPDVRDIVIRQLADLGYSVTAAESASAALALLKDGASVDLMFTDLVMPGGMNGQDLARAARAMRPRLKVLFTSGYPGNALRDADRLPEGEHFLSKPYRKQDLARKLREVLDS